MWSPYSCRRCENGRSNDVPLLVEFFLKRYNDENRKAVAVSPDAQQVILAYEWPGNVRELENCIERLVVMSHTEAITSADLPPNIRDQSMKTRFAEHLKDALPATVEDIEKTKILEALHKTGWVQAKAARLLGITPRQIGYKMKKYGLEQAG